MIHTPHLLALLLVAAISTVECAAAKPKPVDAPRPVMTVKEARAALVESLKQSCWRNAEFKVYRNKVTIYGEMRSHNREMVQLSFSAIKTLSYEFLVKTYFEVFSDGKPLSVFTIGPDRETIRIVWGGKNSRPYVTMFIDAIQVLKKAAMAPDTEDFAAFSSRAQTWLTATPKAEMPREARTYKLVAEDAFKRKDFPAALDAYGEALDRFPMWPEGQYNAAVLAAEIEDYELAARHMRRYLALAPDAKDAAAAEDKLLLWQHKANE